MPRQEKVHYKQSRALDDVPADVDTKEGKHQKTVVLAEESPENQQPEETAE